MGYNLIDSINEFEAGSMQETEMVSLFQTLIDTGIVWHLQGMYGVIAARLIQDGRCHPPVKPTNDNIELVDIEEDK